MKVSITCEHRFVRTPDGTVWTNGVNAYEFWTRYLAVFESVSVIARVRDAHAIESGWKPANGAAVDFTAIPYYAGVGQYLPKALGVRRTLRNAVASDSAAILRVGSHIAGCLERFLAKAGHPYGLEVVNDPYDVFSPGAVRYLGRPLFRWHYTRQLRRQCRNARAVAYVTRSALQARYPSPAYSAGISDVEIPPDAFVAGPRSVLTQSRPLRLITLASLAQMYKAPDVLIRAVEECRRNGIDASLDILGEGKHRPELERLTSSLGLRDAVFFQGHIPAGAAVRKYLDTADIFVLPSRCEGLPRAMLEAMARSVPCIGSRIGGIPELLEAEDLVAPGDVSALALKIREVSSSPKRMVNMSVRNLAVARKYCDDVLATQRKEFFEQVRRATAEWLKRSVERASPGETEYSA